MSHATRSPAEDRISLIERKAAFNKWLRDEGTRLGYYALPPQLQGRVHSMLQRAFNRGARHERRLQEPIQVGGRD